MKMRTTLRCRIDTAVTEQKTHFSTNVRGSRSLVPTPSAEHTLSRERGVNTRLDLCDTFSLPFATTGSPSRGPLLNCGR